MATEQQKIDALKQSVEIVKSYGNSPNAGASTAAGLLRAIYTEIVSIVNEIYPEKK